MDKKVQVEVEDSELEESSSGNTQGPLTSAVYDILSVTHQGVSEIALTLQALLEVEKEQLDVKWGRARVDQECMLHLRNVAVLQH